MNVNFNSVGMVLGAAPAKSSSASYEQVIAAVEKNLNLEEFSSELKIEYNGKIWTATLHSAREGGGLKIAEFSGQREDGMVLRRKGGQFSQRNKGAAQYIALGERASEGGVFKTDYSFKDVLELARLKDEYDNNVFEKVKIDGRELYHSVLVAKAAPGKKPFYHKREMWVDPQTMVPVKMDVFGSTGQKLKTILITKTQSFQGINYPVELLIKSALRDTETKITITNLRALERNKIFQYRD